MLPHLGNKRPGMPNLGNSVMYQASQVKKKVRTKGLLRAFFGSPINACLCLVIVGVFASGGIFYGFLINNLDQGTAEHDPHGGFWGRKTSINATINMTGSDHPSAIPMLQKQKIFNMGKGKGKGKEETFDADRSSGEGEMKPVLKGLSKRGGAGKDDSDAAAATSDAAGTVRGADPARRKQYSRDSGKMFECDGGAVKIAWDKINDEFCDCADASDEPGTSACDNGHFFCAGSVGKGKGNAGSSVTSSKVNDGICDCCDGGDEWGRPDVACDNKC